MILNDLTIVDMVDNPPPKLLKALATIASVMHPAFDQVVPPGKSKGSCVLCSLAVRDFLWKIGFKQATVAPVYFVVRSFAEDGTEIHSVGCGDHAALPAQAAVHGHVVDTKNYWSGHLVVLVDGWLIDTTVYQAQRKHWPDLPGMLAVPLFMEERDGMTLVSGMSVKQEDGSEMFVAWWAQPENRRWKTGGDAEERDRRAPVVKALVQAFGRWVQVDG